MLTIKRNIVTNTSESDTVMAWLPLGKFFIVSSAIQIWM